MEAWIKKVEAGGLSFEQVKLSDKHLSKISEEWKNIYRNQQERNKKTFKKYFYRQDANMLCPLPGGRVGGLSSPVKRYKMAKRQLGRTKYTTPPVHERGEWDARFTVRKQMSTELFCDKVYPPKRTPAEEQEIALAEIADTFAHLNTAGRDSRGGRSPLPSSPSAHAPSPMQGKSFKYQDEAATAANRWKEQEDDQEQEQEQEQEPAAGNTGPPSYKILDIFNPMRRWGQGQDQEHATGDARAASGGMASASALDYVDYTDDSPRPKSAPQCASPSSPTPATAIANALLEPPSPQAQAQGQRQARNSFRSPNRPASASATANSKAGTGAGVNNASTGAGIRTSTRGMSQSESASAVLSLPTESADMTEFWNAVYGPQVETPATREHRLIVEREEQFIALAKEKQATRSKLATMTLDKLRQLSAAGLCDFFDKIGLQHYTGILFERGVTGEDVSMCDEFDLSHMGITYRPHRLRILRLLDRLRGADTSAFRRSLTKTLIDANLTLPARPAPAKDGYELVIAEARLTHAELAALAMEEAQKAAMDRMRSQNAAADAKRLKRLNIKLARVNEFYRDSRAVLTAFQERVECENDLLKTEETAASKQSETKETERIVAEKLYALRQQLRAQSRAQGERQDSSSSKARLRMHQSLAHAAQEAHQSDAETEAEAETEAGEVSADAF